MASFDFKAINAKYASTVDKVLRQLKSAEANAVRWREALLKGEGEGKSEGPRGREVKMWTASIGVYSAAATRVEVAVSDEGMEVLGRQAYADARKLYVAWQEEERRLVDNEVTPSGPAVVDAAMDVVATGPATQSEEARPLSFAEVNAAMLCAAEKYQTMLVEVGNARAQTFMQTGAAQLMSSSWRNDQQASALHAIPDPMCQRLATEMASVNGKFGNAIKLALEQPVTQYRNLLTAWVGDLYSSWNTLVGEMALSDANQEVGQYLSDGMAWWEARRSDAASILQDVQRGRSQRTPRQRMMASTGFVEEDEDESMS